MDVETSNYQAGMIVLAFVDALAQRNFIAAYEMLSESHKKEMTLIELRENFEHMFKVYRDLGYEDADRINEVNLINTISDIVDWPTKKPSEIASMYVAIVGDTWTEGMSITVENSQLGKLCIGEIIWGRP